MNVFETYPGGKAGAGVYQRLINLMPPHSVYIETHLGGGAVMQHKRPAPRNIGIDIDPAVVQVWTAHAPKVELICGDAIATLERLVPELPADALVYADPPYLLETRRGGRLYTYEYTVSDHEALIELLLALPCQVMISGYWSSLYNMRLRDWHLTRFTAKTRQGVATECVWMNYAPPVELHDYRFLGTSFRERERIRRKKQRWVARLSTLPVLERQALLAAIEQTRGDAALPAQSEEGM